MYCNECREQMKQGVNQGVAYCSGCGKQMVGEAFCAPHGTLMRPKVGRKIAGVCAGFALQYGFDVTLLRVLLAVAVVMGAGTPLIAYVAAWVLMPEAPYAVPQNVQGAAAA